MSNKKKYEMTNEELEEITKLPVIAKIPYDTKIHKSLNLKMPISLLHPNHSFTREMIKRDILKFMVMPAQKAVEKARP